MSKANFESNMRKILAESEAKLNDLRLEIEKAKRVGFAVVEQEKQYEHLRNEIDLFKKVYNL